jgi:hypothetical protein
MGNMPSKKIGNSGNHNNVSGSLDRIERSHRNRKITACMGLRTLNIPQ